MRKYVGLLLLVVASLVLIAQPQRAARKTPPIDKLTTHTFSKKELKQFRLYEDSLKRLAWRIVNDSTVDEKKQACYAFVPMLVRALRKPNSFFYPFDSLKTISRLYPPDSTFRLFTWQLYTERGRTRYFGMIQMRSEQLRFFPLLDVSDTLDIGTQDTLTHRNWWGQLYYNIIQKTIGGRNYYTLFGFEAPDILTRRKIIETLWFNPRGEPMFGLPLFHFKYTDTLNRTKLNDTLSRFFMEYKWNASTVLNYDRELDMIVFDHVVPPDPKAKDANFMYVPDGTYEGFVWKSDRWNWVEKVFTFAINQNDNPPIPEPKFSPPGRQPIYETDEPKKKK